MPRRRHFRRQHAAAVMVGKLPQFRIQFRVVNARFDHPGLQVVDDDGIGHAAEIPERIFQRPDKTFGTLRVTGLTVTFTAAVQDNPEQMGFLPLSPPCHRPSRRFRSRPVPLSLVPIQCGETATHISRSVCGHTV